jgi:hypothetical protein
LKNWVSRIDTGGGSFWIRHCEHRVEFKSCGFSAIGLSSLRIVAFFVDAGSQDPSLGGSGREPHGLVAVGQGAIEVALQ